MAVSACGCNVYGAINGHGTGRGIVIGADTHSVTADCTDNAAIDRDVTAPAAVVLADGCAAAAVSYQRARAGNLGLSVNGQLVTVGNGDACTGRQRHDIGEDQLDVAMDGDAFIHIEDVIDHIPAVRLVIIRPRLVFRRKHYGVVGLGIAVFVDVVYVLLSLAVRDRDLVHNPVDRHLHPFGGGEGLQRFHDPFTVVQRGVEQILVADLCRRHFAGEIQRCQDFGHGNGGVAGQHVFQVVVGKLHRVQRKAVGDGRDRVGLGFRFQLFGSQAVALVGHVVHVGFQVFVLDLGQRKAHLHVVAGGGLELVTLAVQHLDVEGIGGGHVLVLVAHILDGFAGLVAKVAGDALHRQGRPIRERP